MAAPPKGKLSRIARLGGLASRVGSSYVGERLKSVVRDKDARRRAMEKLHLDNAERIVDTVGRLKGAAMKLGQSLALAADTLDLPPEVQSMLGRLHDDVEPVPFSQIQASIERELDTGLTDAFTWIDPQPLGTASLGQAHAARLRDGREVVVKVLHPGIDRSVDSDLAALKTILIGSRVMRRTKAEIDAIFEEIRERLTEELDYLQEAANLVQFGALFANDDRVQIPGVHANLSTERVLTMDRIHGVSIDEFARTASPQARHRAGVTLGELHHLQAFQFRTLHADPHPGNYLFQPDGKVGMLDFGCVKRFDEHWIAAYARTALAAFDGDRQGTLEGAAAAGVWQGGSREAEDLLWEFCETLAHPFRQETYTVGASTDDVMDKVNGIGLKLVRHPGAIKVHRHLIYLHRSLGGIFLVGRQLEVEANWGAIVRPHLQYAVDYARGGQRATSL
jgi:predicted unusual protein kinase regulating ubiquinone biosynthesis (AarF/ABC1/UbiB family)